MFCFFIYQFILIVKSFFMMLWFKDVEPVSDFSSLVMFSDDLIQRELYSTLASLNAAWE